MSISKPAWVPCDCCDNFICTIHGGHAHDCDCPPLDVWDADLGMVPYDEGGDLTPEALKARLEEAGYDPDQD